jgi:probable rRNA maturation factor
MPDLVEAVVEDDRWQAAGIVPVAETAGRATLRALGRDPDLHEVALLLCDDARIAGLNAGFRGRAAATNVLSWPAFDGAVPDPEQDEPLFLGDLALGYETCAREAAEAGITLADHAAHLVVHGVLHLLGHDHADEAEAEAMEALETKVLASMGVANPYSREERPSGAAPGQE